MCLLLDLKEDSCNATGNHTDAFHQYGLMRDALNSTGRAIYFDLCGWSDWYAPVGKTLGNAWRVGYDVNNWGGVMNNAIAVDKNLAQYAGPGGWNDIDALIGMCMHTLLVCTPVRIRTLTSKYTHTYKHTRSLRDPLMTPHNLVCPAHICKIPGRYIP